MKRSFLQLDKSELDWVPVWRRFTHWLAETGNSLLASFGKVIVADLAAVKAALTEPWSNGPTQRQITKLKRIKRQMYGRAHLDLLRARLVVSVCHPPPNCTACKSEFFFHAETQRGVIISFR